MIDLKNLEAMGAEDESEGVKQELLEKLIEHLLTTPDAQGASEAPAEAVAVEAELPVKEDELK